MYTKRFGRYPRHRKLPLRQQLQFLGLSALSLAAVFTIAMLSRAELRLSGDTLAADGHELAVMEKLQPFDRVEFLRETPELRLYLLTRGSQQYLAHVIRKEEGTCVKEEDGICLEESGGIWEIDKVERIHR